MVVFINLVMYLYYVLPQLQEVLAVKRYALNDQALYYPDSFKWHYFGV